MCFAIFGTSYASPEPDGALYVWTDAVGDHHFADFNASGDVDTADLALFDALLQARDGGPRDSDATINGVVHIPNVGPGFSVYDLDADGAIGPPDRAALAPPPLVGDANDDCIVNFADLTSVLTHWGAVIPPGSPTDGDANADGHADFADITAILTAWGSQCP